MSQFVVMSGTVQSNRQRKTTINKTETHLVRLNLLALEDELLPGHNNPREGLKQLLELLQGGGGGVDLHIQVLFACCPSFVS